jgi:serine/threonine protein kinase/tetratricopeptide (TPR) repeat protein
MASKFQGDDLTMSLVEEALSRPEDQREAYLRNACGSNTKRFEEALNYIVWEKRMQGFLLDPLQTSNKDVCPFEPGQLLINRFRVIREIAQGGMGIVCEAIDERLKRRVALKCAKAGYGKQLPPEVRNASQIAHPNVCKIFEIHTASTIHGEIDFISMEFLEGETLADRLRRAPLPERDARTIAQQLCAGLAEAHRNRLVHGDLKTNNVILTNDAQGALRAVITDFGLAQATDASAAILGGTPAYMAPELWKGAKSSVQSDIYALGIILWEIHSGRSPSELGVTSSTLSSGEMTSWKPPRGWDKWNRVIAHCLHPDPTCRFPAATDVLEALGPSRAAKRLLAAGIGLLLVTSSAIITYQRINVPAETVRLAMLPFSTAPDFASVSETLLHETANRLARLKGTPHTHFKFISEDDLIRGRVKTPEEARVLATATHTLTVTLERQGEIVVVNGFLTDVRSGAELRKWTARYKPAEVGYAPAALAGLVTEAVHLPPLSTNALINAKARPDYQKGLSFLRGDKNIDAAVAAMSSAVAADPGSALAYAGLAEAQWAEYHDSNDGKWLNQATESARLAQYRNPDLAEVHRIMGLLEQENGASEAAKVEYKRAIELEPNNGDGYRRLGIAYRVTNQFNEALAAFRKAVQVQPSDFRPYLELYSFYFYLGEYGEAIKHCRKAIEVAPGEPKPRFALANLYVNRGYFNEAEREIRESIRLRETPASLETLGLDLLYERKERDAIPILIRAAKLGPEHQLTWLDLGICYRRTHQASAAYRANRLGLQAAEAEVTKNPSNGWARTHLAYLCAYLGQQGRAKSEIDQALRSMPDNADTHFMAVLTYEAIQMRDRALAVLADSTADTIEDVGRWPDVADLQKDLRYVELRKIRGLK